MGRLEVDGRSLVLGSWIARRPLHCLEGRRLEVAPPEGLDPQQTGAYGRLAAFLDTHRRRRFLNGFLEALPGTGGTWALLLLLLPFYGWGLTVLNPGTGAFPTPGVLGGALLAGAALAAGRLKGLTALVWAVAGILAYLTLQPDPVPPMLLLAALALVWAFGGIRLLGPLPWVLALLAAPGTFPARMATPHALYALLPGLAAGFLALHREKVALASGRDAIWRFEILAKALAEVDKSQLWALHPVFRAQAPPEAAHLAPVFLSLDRDQQPWEAVSPEGRWIFFPDAVLEVQDASGTARLVPRSRIRVEGTPCSWPAAPPGMGDEQFALSLRGEGLTGLDLVFGHGWQGRRLLQRLSQWIGPGEAVAPEAIAPVDSDEAEAWRLLGLAPGASAKDLQRAYHRQARRFHPDFCPNLPEAERREREDLMVRLNDAYDRLRRQKAA